MTISTHESSRTRSQYSMCPHCGRSIDIPGPSPFVENALSVLAALVLALMLVPLAVIAWKSCSVFFRTKYRTRSSIIRWKIRPNTGNCFKASGILASDGNSKRPAFTWMSALDCGC
jgi:hypothetical protein